MKHGDFTELAEEYARYRPGYAPLISDTLFGLAAPGGGPLDIVDAGAGTGIWSRSMLGPDRNVMSVEPNEAMRAQGIRLTEEAGDGITWIDGSAEQTSLPDQCCDIVTMASSFHWPDFDQAVREFDRILRPGGHFMALWNTRHIASNPILVEIEAELNRIVPNMKRVSSGKSEFCDNLFEALKAREEFADVMYAESRHVEVQSIERYIGLWMSVNDVRVQAGEERFMQFIDYIKDRLADEDSVKAEYLTRAWIARKRG